MAGSVNKAIIVGNVGRDPEVRNLNNGGRVVSFSVATSETWTDRASGERREKTQWHRVVIWNEKLGEIAEKYLRKGSKVYLEGTIESRKYTDKDGHERETTEIVLQRFGGTLTLLGDPSSGERGGDRAGGERRGAPRGAPTGGEYTGRSSSDGWSAGSGYGGGNGNLDDEIPF